MLRVVVACLILAAVPSPSAARDDDRIEYLLAGFRNNYGRFRSGVATVTGGLVDRGPGVGELTGPVTLFTAFDSDADLFRFDRTQPVRVAANGDAPPAGGWKAGTGGGKYVRTPTRALVWNSLKPGVALVVPREYRPTPVIAPFHPHLIGLAMPSDFNDGHKFPDPVGGLAARMAKGQVAEQAGVTSVSWREDDLDLTVRFDRAFGSMPSSYEVLQYDTKAKAKVLGPSKTAWQKQGGVYVPISLYLQTFDQGDKYYKVYDLQFAWTNINEPVNPALFSANGADLPVGTVIADNKSELRGRSLGKVGDLTPSPKLAALEVNPPPPPKPGWPWWVWPLAAVALLAAGTVVLLVRRRR